MTIKTDELRTTLIENLASPAQLAEQIPLSTATANFIMQSRKEIEAVISGEDKRLLVIIGPCSIHDTNAAIDYAKKLTVLRDKYKNELLIVMRVYFEKPRTTVGWKGLINDPHMDGSFDVETGLRKARELILYLTELGLPLATEALDPISPQYLAEAFSWSAIGARTTESQTHREMASGLSMPIGFKNGTNGSLGVAVNALQSAASPHHFMGINRQGQVALIQTRGNPDGHVILRGGAAPNYDEKSIAECEQALAKQGIEPGIIVDCSHGNSSKDYTRQPLVAQDVVAQICAGNKSIIGIMLESNINAGNQSSYLAKEDLAYGVSVTDACIDFAQTEQLLADTDVQLSGCLTSRIA
jgi:3-deoxy-7-phosphoheptulonate synthase